MGEGLGTYSWPVIITVPAGTAQSSPQKTSPKLGQVWLDSIELRTPPGHKGTTGILVANSGTPLLPYSNTSTYLTTDDETTSRDFGIEVDTGLQVFTFNTDIVPHVFYLHFIGRPMVLQNPPIGEEPTAIVPVFAW
jgi:hypothetical protein